MTPKQKYEMWKKSREKYRSTSKGIAKRKEYKQSEKSKNIDRAYRQLKKDDPVFKKKRKKYYEETKEKLRPIRSKYVTDRRKTDILFKLSMSMRSRMNLFIKRSKFNKNARTFKLIGCSPEDLKKHLEKQFRPGMNWSNHGSWHIDHIKPLASAKSVDEMNVLFHYTNLQPLWAEENIKKKDKY